METVRLVINDDPVPPSRLVPRLARDLETICLKCLHKDPQKRYATAEELADDLDRYREGNADQGQADPGVGARVKWSKRRPVAAMSVAARPSAVHRPDRGIIVYLRAEPETAERLGRPGAKPGNGAARPGRQGQRPRSSSRMLRSSWPSFFKTPRTSLDSSRSRSSVEAKQKSVDDQLRERELSARDGRRNAIAQDRERFQKFLELRQDAQLYAAGLRSAASRRTDSRSSGPRPMPR